MALERVTCLLSLAKGETPGLGGPGHRLTSGPGDGWEAFLHRAVVEAPGRAEGGTRRRRQLDTLVNRPWGCGPAPRVGQLPT